MSPLVPMVVIESPGGRRSKKKGPVREPLGGKHSLGKHCKSVTRGNHATRIVCKRNLPPAERLVTREFRRTL